MKFLFSFILSFYFLTANAQNEFGTITLQNGTKLEGLVKIRNNGDVKFKKSNTSEVIKYAVSQITNIWISDHYYEPLEIERLLGGTKIELVEIVIKGKTTLFKKEVTGGGMAMGGMNGLYESWAAWEYYLKKDDKFVKLGSRINNKDLIYFEDCPAVMEKINSKEFGRRDIEAIVGLYNLKCK